jgi:mono/diheme cytochrome c family protein
MIVWTQENLQRTATLVCLLVFSGLSLYFCFLIASPFFASVTIAVILGVVLHPLPARLHSRTKTLLRMVLSCTSVAIVVITGAAQNPKPQKPKDSRAPAQQANLLSGRNTFVQYCASCHGTVGKGDGPAAFAMKAPPPDLTMLAKRHEGKFPAGYVGALLKFGRNLASHGSEDMPVWGTRFRSLDPEHDPTGQQHTDAVVAYIGSLQVK